MSPINIPAHFFSADVGSKPSKLIEVEARLHNPAVTSGSKLAAFFIVFSSMWV